MKRLSVLILVLAGLGFSGLFLSCGGGSGGGGGAADGPRVSGTALFYDINKKGLADSGDTITVTFDDDITVSAAAPDDFALTEASDSLGTGGSVSAGPGTDQVTITLGSGPSLKSRQTYTPGQTGSNRPSGIDVSTALAPGALVSGTSGEDAIPSTPVDIVPGFVDSGQTIEEFLSPSAVAVGDLDNDGDLDVIYGNSGQVSTVWFNNGAGILTDSGQNLGTFLIRGLAVGDLDRDGYLDLVYGTSSGQPNLLWFNDGAGTFSSDGSTVGSNSTRAVVLGDVDRDGDLDAVIYVTDQFSERVLAGAADGLCRLWSSFGALGSRRAHSIARQRRIARCLRGASRRRHRCAQRTRRLSIDGRCDQ